VIFWEIILHLIQNFQKKAEYLTSLGQQGGTLFWKEVINQIPKILFVLLPFFALILKLIYMRNKILYIEHFIFSLHAHTFAFLLLIPCIFFPKLIVIVPVIIGILVYLYFSIRNFYKQSYIKTFIKTNFMIFLYALGLLPAFMLLILLAFVSV
jgi:hypothetical protein